MQAEGHTDSQPKMGQAVGSRKLALGHCQSYPGVGLVRPDRRSTLGALGRLRDVAAVTGHARQQGPIREGITPWHQNRHQKPHR